MNPTRTLSTTAVSLSLLLALSACASLPEGKQLDPQDPFERYNRAAFSFNDTVDRAVLKPIATAYKTVVPGFAQTGVHNVFANIADLPTALNQFLQGKPKQAFTQLGRVTLNTTFGLLGLIDVASKVGLERTREDFGQTLGRWGVGSGAYLVLPLFGPSTLRDATGLPLDLWATPLQTVTPVAVRNSLTVLGFVDARAEALPVTKMIDDIALDKYLFVRDAYLQRRLSRLEVEPAPQMAEARPQLGPGPATSRPQNLAPMRSP